MKPLHQKRVHQQRVFTILCFIGLLFISVNASFTDVFQKPATTEVNSIGVLDLATEGSDKQKLPMDLTTIDQPALASLNVTRQESQMIDAKQKNKKAEDNNRRRLSSEVDEILEQSRQISRLARQDSSLRSQANQIKELVDEPSGRSERSTTLSPKRSKKSDDDDEDEDATATKKTKTGSKDKDDEDEDEDDKDKNDKDKLNVKRFKVTTNADGSTSVSVVDKDGKKLEEDSKSSDPTVVHSGSGNESSASATISIPAADGSSGGSASASLVIPNRTQNGNDQPPATGNDKASNGEAATERPTAKPTTTSTPEPISSAEEGANLINEALDIGNKMLEELGVSGGLNNQAIKNVMNGNLPEGLDAKVIDTTLQSMGIQAKSGDVAKALSAVGVKDMKEMGKLFKVLGITGFDDPALDALLDSLGVESLVDPKLGELMKSLGLTSLVDPGFLNLLESLGITSLSDPKVKDLFNQLGVKGLGDPKLPKILEANGIKGLLDPKLREMLKKKDKFKTVVAGVGGALGGVLLLGGVGVGYLCWRRRKAAQAAEEEEDVEMSESDSDSDSDD